MTTADLPPILPLGPPPLPGFWRRLRSTFGDLETYLAGSAAVTGFGLLIPWHLLPAFLPWLAAIVAIRRNITPIHLNPYLWGAALFLHGVVHLYSIGSEHAVLRRRGHMVSFALWLLFLFTIIRASPRVVTSGILPNLALMPALGSLWVLLHRKRKPADEST